MSEFLTVPEQLEKAGINVHTLRKGDFYSPEQVNLAYGLFDEKLPERIARYERGELRTDPMSFASQKVIEHITKLREQMNSPVVCRSDGGGVKVLTDAEAATYLNAQANAGLRKHRSKTIALMTAVDSSQLTDHERRQLEADQRKHAFILASHQGARAQSLRMQRKGLQLPDFKNELGDKTKA